MHVVHREGRKAPQKVRSFRDKAVRARIQGIGYDMLAIVRETAPYAASF